jgi:hypothetical protein
MQTNQKNEPEKQVPRPEIKISGHNTILTYRPSSFYDLHLAVRQINELINNVAVGSEIFSVKRGVTVQAARPEGEDCGMVLRFLIPKRINDMSLIGQAIDVSKSE